MVSIYYFKVNTWYFILLLFIEWVYIEQYASCILVFTAIAHNKTILILLIICTQDFMLGTEDAESFEGHGLIEFFLINYFSYFVYLIRTEIGLYWSYFVYNYSLFCIVHLDLICTDHLWYEMFVLFCLSGLQ